MKKIFSTPLSAIMFFLYMILAAFFTMIIRRWFDLALWSSYMFFVSTMWFGSEVAYRFGSTDISRPSAFVWDAQPSDRFVFFTSLVIGITLNFLEGWYLKEINFWLGLLISFSNILLLVLVINMFGSREFRQIFNKKMTTW